MADLKEDVCFNEQNYHVRTLRDAQELLQSYRLRHSVYCDTLKWVEPSPDRLEMDRYDPGAISLGVYGDAGELVGLARILTSNQAFMIEDEFRSLIPAEHAIRKEADTVEITRLTTLLPFNHRNQASRTVSSLIYKGIYQWSVMHGVRYLYFVVEARFLRALRLMGFPCTAVGPVTALKGGVQSVAAFLDWARFREHALSYNPQMLDWISGGLPDLSLTARSTCAGAQAQPYASALIRQVSP
jgi:N-acyl-L-homoserine lactone synthetase